MLIPPSVHDEIVVRGRGKPGAEEVEHAPWITVRRPVDRAQVAEIELRFDSGESEAIALALEIGALLLVDERIVIAEARRRGLEVTTTLLMLRQARKAGLIASVKQEIDDPIAAGFRVKPELVDTVLREVGQDRESEPRE